MGKKGKVGKNRQDKFYHLAKEHGFRSRSSFKLVQLNRRHDFLTSASRGVIDLCAAPGGWMQVARKHMPLSAPCIGIDLVSIKTVPGCIAVVGDITSDAIKGELKRTLRASGGADKVDVVLNDGSPNMGTAWLQDAYTQSELTLAALKLASEFLAKGGTFISKVFRSNDYNSLLFVMNQLFSKVNATKPSASRAESAEIYVMCIDFKAPKSIDPRLLSPKHVFKDLETADPNAANKPDLLLNTVMKDMKKRKRHRGGYEDGQNILFKRLSVLSFCQTSRPVAMMIQTNQFSFDPRDIESENISHDDAVRVAKTLESMSQTSSELLSCCEDLKVLARREFKLLLKWRSFARDTLQKDSLLYPEQSGKEEPAEAAEKTLKDPIVESNEKAQESDSEEERLNEDIKSAMAEQLVREKRKKRKSNKLRNATQRKIDMKIILPEHSSGYEDSSHVGLFSLETASRALKHGVHLTDVPAADPDKLGEVDAGYEGDEEEVPDKPVIPYKAGDIDAPWEDDIKDVEKDLDRWYKLYLSERKRDKNGIVLGESKERKRVTKRKAIRDAMNKETEPEEKERTLDINSSESSAEEPSDDEFHVPKKISNSREAALWFANPVFQDLPGLYSSDSDMDDKTGAEVGGNNQYAREGKKGSSLDRHATDAEDANSFKTAARSEAHRVIAKAERKMTEDGDGFDVVPMQKEKKTSNRQTGKKFRDSDEESDSSFHSSDYDTDEKAEMVTIGKRMRQSKTEASEVLDDAYNRYTFDDPTDLPRWFADPDPVYRERQPPVTKEQVVEMKEYIKSLQAAPTKKEQEAKARKRARVAKKMDAMKTKANNIAEQADVPASSRMRAIEELYKKAMKSDKSSKKGRSKEYQVVRPNGRISVGKDISKGRKGKRGVSTVLVDRRLKADKRGLKKAMKTRGKGRK